MKGEGRALGRMPLTVWHTVGAQKRWLLPFGFCSPSPSPTSDFPVPKHPLPFCAVRTAALTCTDGSQRLSSPLRREARRPRAVRRAAPSAQRPGRGPGDSEGTRRPVPHGTTGTQQPAARVPAPRHAGRGARPSPGRRGAGREAEARASASRSRTRRSRGLGGGGGSGGGEDQF